MTDYTDNYKNLLIKQYWNKTNAAAEIELKSATFERIYSLLRSFETEFDLDLASGDRLDKIGKIVGISREDLEPYFDLFFGFDDNPFSLPFGDKGYWDNLLGYTSSSIANMDYFDMESGAGTTVLTLNTNGDNQAYYSTDGATISQVSGLNNYTPNSAIYINDLSLFVMTGETTGSSSYDIATSPDGINWTKRDAAGLTYLSFSAISYCSHNGLILSASRSAPTVQMIRSTDGINWAYSTLPHNPGVITCSDYSPVLRKALFLTGGATTGEWTLTDDGQNFEYGSVSGKFSDVKWSNSIESFVSALDQAPATIKLFDGSSWTTHATTHNIIPKSISISPDNVIHIYGVDNGAGYTEIVSTDGVNWTAGSHHSDGDIYGSSLDESSNTIYTVTRSDSYLSKSVYTIEGQVLGGKFYDKFYTNTIPGVLTDDEYRYYIKAKISINSASGYMVSDEYISIQQIIQYLFDGYAIVFDNQRMQLTLEVESSIEKGRVLLAKGLNLLPRPQGVEYNSVNLAGYDYFGFDDDPNALGFGDGSDISIGGIFAEAIA